MSTDPTSPWLTHPSFEVFRGATCLVTGGAGFIGGHLGRSLARLGARVRVIDDLSGGFVDNLDPSTEFVQASILDEAALERAVRGATYVFHQAAMVSVPQSVEQPGACVRVNVEGTQRVLSACVRSGVRRVLFAASAAAYGNNPSLPSRETDVPDAWSPYAMSKIAGEHLLACFARNHDLSTVSLRYMNIFGERQNANSAYAAVISAFAKALRAGTRPTIFGDGRQTRDFTHVANVVRANLLAAASPRELRGEVINVGTGVRTDLLRVLEVMGKVLGVRAEPHFMPPRAGDVRDSVADIARAREVLGYEPVMGFEEGLRRLLTM